MHELIAIKLKRSKMDHEIVPDRWGENSQYSQSECMNLATYNIEGNLHDLQPPPNQDSIYKIDSVLHNIRKEAYIERLLQMLNKNENILSWYRAVLVSRARSINDCPQGDMKNRKQQQTLLKHTNMYGPLQLK